MKNDFLKKTGYLSLALLAVACFRGTQSSQLNANPTPATIVGALAADSANSSEFIKKFFDGTKNAEFFVDSLVINLEKFNPAFADLKNEAAPTDTVVQFIFDDLGCYPQVLQDLFTGLGEQECKQIINETHMLDILDNLVSQPIKRPLLMWPELIDRTEKLLAGNAQYAEFVTLLKSLNNSYRNTIVIYLGKFFNSNSDKIPATIVAKAQALGLKRMKSRIFWKESNRPRS